MEKKTQNKEEVQERQKMHYAGSNKFVLDKAIELNYPVLLVGDTGTGKTSFIRDISLERKKELIRLNLTGQTGIDEILGKWLAGPDEKGQPHLYWVDGLLVKAMKEGHWIVFDEINMALPEILSVLHSLLDDDRKIVLKEKDGGIIKPQKGFRFFATMNPSDDYVGTKELNKAFLSRFPVVMDVDYSTKESEIIAERSGIKKDDADRLVLAAKEIRKQKAKSTLSYVCSTRDLISCANLLANKYKLSDALALSIFNKAEDKDERKNIEKTFALVTGKNIKIATRKGDREFESISDIKKYVDGADNLMAEAEEKKKEVTKKLVEIKKDIDKFKEDSVKKEKELKVKITKLEKVKGKTADVEELEILKKELKRLLTQSRITKQDVRSLNI